MKHLKLLSLSCLLLSFPIYAEEGTVDSPTTVSPTIEQQANLQKLINQVKSAPNKEKRVLMNQLKVQLKSMNKESRQKAMKELKKSFAKKEHHNQQKQHQLTNHESCQHGNHQPKFRHLRKGPKDGTGSPRGQGAGGQQGNGQK